MMENIHSADESLPEQEIREVEELPDYSHVDNSHVGERVRYRGQVREWAPTEYTEKEWYTHDGPGWDLHLFYDPSTHRLASPDTNKVFNDEQALSEQTYYEWKPVYE